MKKSLTALLLFTFQFFIASSQNVGIGTNTPTAKLEIASTNSGILIPRLTTTARNIILNPSKGLLVYDSTAKQFYYHDGTGWKSMSAGTSSLWQLNGIAGTEIKNTNAGGFWSTANMGLTTEATNITNPPTAPSNGPGTRLMWIPSRSAFRAGTVADVDGTGSKNWDKDSIGLFSFAIGINTKASGLLSTALGYKTIASETVSTAIGFSNAASGYGSTAMGFQTTASQEYSTAMGFNTTASGHLSTAMGSYTTASGTASTAMGYKTTSFGVASTATGQYTTASGEASTAMGSYGSTNDHKGSFIIHDNIFDNIDGITRNSLDNQMIMKFDGGFGFYSGGASAPSMGFEKTQGLSVYGSNIRVLSGVVTANGVTLTSDQRFKNTISNINYGLNTIMKLRPVSYLWNADRVHNNNALKGTQLGFIAQEVEKVIPSAVLTDADNLQSKSIKYMEIIPVLTKAIQEQQAQIEMLQQQLNEIKASTKK